MPQVTASASLSAGGVLSCSPLSQRIAVPPGNVAPYGAGVLSPVLPEPFVTVPAILDGTYGALPEGPAMTTPQPAEGAPLSPAPPSFESADRGYAMHQVDAWVSGALARLRHLEERLAGVVAGVVQAPQAQQSVADLMRLALDEVEGNRAAALADAERLLADARATAMSLQATSRQEAAADASRVLQEARARAESILDDAAARAGAVADGAGRRMAALAAIHDKTIGRLREVNDVTGRMLQLEGDRGTLSDEVDRVMSGAPAPDAPGRPAPSGQQPG
jgi:hypothetical protein